MQIKSHLLGIGLAVSDSDLYLASQEQRGPKAVSLLLKMLLVFSQRIEHISPISFGRWTTRGISE